ncbi:hypothetical protein ACVIGA_005163 [Bradyrhizobium sp. USDA 3240]
MQFLDEVGALLKIREILGSAATAKIAVAFWGQGAIEALGLARSELDIDVVCNLDSGACNPSEIERLRRIRPHVPVRSDPRLHGKLYWTSNGLVLGSSNASTNGLAIVDGLGGWAEANIFSDDPKVIAAALNWFESRKNNAYEVTDAHLALAEQIWLDRRRISPTGLELTTDLGAAVRGSPEHVAWTKVKLAIYSEGLSVAAERELNANLKANPALREFDIYEGWQSEIRAGDWLLDFELDGNDCSFGGYWSVPNPKIETKLLTYVHEETAVSLSGFGTLTLSTKDLNSCRRAARDLVLKKGVGSTFAAMVPIKDAIEFIDTHQNESVAPKSIAKVFESAMRGVFVASSKIGYRPTEFLRMIERDGALPTAKHLILSSTPSSGFTKLWELKRLDLTVEALALREPWRGLFSIVELERAERRLKQYGFRERT